MLSTDPASTSGCVIVYVAAHVVESPAASVVAGQVTDPTFGSLTVTPVKVTDPVLVTRKLKSIVSPASTRPLPLRSAGVPATLSRVNVALVSVGVDVESGAESIAGPVGGVPVAVAVLSTDPPFTSALLRIPRFGRSYVMPVLEGTSDDVLSQGFGHFADTAPPGAVGNYALAAHRITHGEPLRKMPDLRPGDQVLVETRRAVYTYVLDTNPNDLIVPFTSGWVIDPVPVNPSGGVTPDPKDGNRLITLTTCSEIFHTDDRMIAFGHLRSVRQKG
jgi:sortase (surface protein transpeptidase)